MRAPFLEMCLHKVRQPQGKMYMTSTPLQQLIIERIQKEGPLTFAEYMRMALYDPNYGYYTTGPTKIGWEGDYYTSTDVSAFFAHCMGRQLYQWWQKLGQPVRFIVLEQGAGRGNLAQGIHAWAKRDAPEFYAALDYGIEDIRLGQDVNAPMNNAGTSPPPSVILSNELIDAFPVHIVEARDQRLYEIYVDVQGDRLCEVPGEPSTAEVANYLDSYKIPWTSFGDGWRAEINLDAVRWMRRTAHLFRRGFILVIDYGDKARALYTRYRHRGTLACYFHHQMNERPLVRPGEQDITAHVNFSALIQEGRRQGLRLNKFTTQRLWLEELGIHEELEQRRLSEFAEADTARASDRGQVALLQWYNLRQRVAALTDPTGMGNFKVLILRR
ncbi:MAG: SAM-dependent methyltransferase [Chloroflexi bacterium]|nr:MAG: SAM-dependent methyltransferase [Chloroflexota bacterium]